MEYRIVGIGSGGVDTQTNEIKFELSVANAPPMSFVAEYGPLSQVMGALGRMVFELRKILAASNAMKSAAAETIATSHVQKDRWQDVVLMELTTPRGVPYMFAMSPQVASGIADQLKTESAKPHQTGHA